MVESHGLLLILPQAWEPDLSAIGCAAVVKPANEVYLIDRV